MSATTTSAELTAQIVNPVLTSTKETFASMLGADVSRKFLRAKEANESYLDITAVVGITGVAAGCICISFAETTALRSAEQMMGMPFEKADELVRDTVGEFANVIAGSARLKLVEYDLEIGLPTIIHGAGHQVDFPAACRPLCAGFDTDLGPILIAFGFAQRHTHS